MSRLILASGSAIRKQILDGAGLSFEVVSRTIDEEALKDALKSDGARPHEIADGLAQAKSVAVSRREEGLVIGADQVLVCDGELFDKPRDLDEARARLQHLRGREHRLIGATVVSENGAPVWRNLATTKLWMRDFSDDFLDTYLKEEGERVTQSVGAYRFEGPGAQLFTKVEGDFFAILGLDLLPLLDYLRLRGAIAA